MKGAIGNALILNMVITFVLIFFSLLIGSMAYSKAYKTKNFLINLIDKTEEAGEHDFASTSPGKKDKWDAQANEYLSKVGYPISSNQINNCPMKRAGGYRLYLGNGIGRYDYCIYIKNESFTEEQNQVLKRRYNYLVLVYMRFDVPILGKYLKYPITGETKTYTILR